LIFKALAVPRVYDRVNDTFAASPAQNEGQERLFRPVPCGNAMLLLVERLVLTFLYAGICSSCSSVAVASR
jgi:hypothetical protein